MREYALFVAVMSILAIATAVPLVLLIELTGWEWPAFFALPLYALLILLFGVPLLGKLLERYG